jgi:hypothetical protein
MPPPITPAPPAAGNTITGGDNKRWAIRQTSQTPPKANKI